MEIKILVHLSLGVDQQVTNELLDPSHHYLRLDLKEFVLLLHFVDVLLVALFHFFVLFFELCDHSVQLVHIWHPAVLDLAL